MQNAEGRRRKAKGTRGSGLGARDSGLGAGGPRATASRTPHPAPRIPRRRRGVSILEVIFAILITTIGLLAALTVFPVAAAIARKGRIADETAVGGRAAVHLFDAKGYRRPDMWMGWNQSWDVRVSPPAPPVPPPGFYSVPTIVFPTGTAFCIDPRFVMANTDNAVHANAASIFPYVPPAIAPGARMFRIGLTNGVPSGSMMTKVQADSVFTFADDYTVTRPSDGSLPAYGSLSQGDSNNDGTPDFFTTRSTGGHLSWLATLAPKHELYAPGLVANDLYVLSIVVFHDRPLVDFTVDPIPTGTPTWEDNVYYLGERCAEVDFIDAGGLGFAGGETFFIWPPNGSNVVDDQYTTTPVNYNAAKRQLKVRAGDWVMLSGFTPSSVGAMPVFKWYRVTEADHEPDYHPTEQHYAVAVSLSGPDWDMSLTGTQATIVSGVVGVYEKTVRLETGTGF